MPLIIPEVNGSNWAVDRPHSNKRYSFKTSNWLFVIRDLGCSWLWRLHAFDQKAGGVHTFSRDSHPGQDGLDGLQSLFGAATRKVTGREHPTDKWQIERYPNLYHHLVTGLPA